MHKESYSTEANSSRNMDSSELASHSIAAERARCSATSWIGVLCFTILLISGCVSNTQPASGAISGVPAAVCNPVVTSQPAAIVSQNAVAAATPRVLPQGIVGPTGFDWPDTPLGVVMSSSGSNYLFFASDGSCHANCNLPGERDGSITRTVGTLDNPLGTDPPVETVLPQSANLPPYMVYVGGGPTYRVPAGESGAGSLLLVYQAARLSYQTGYQYPDCDSNGQNCGQHAKGFYSNFGLARSTDEGMTWSDLGLIISPGTPYNPQLTVDLGDGSLVVQSRYFYIYFPDFVDNGNVDTGMSAARVSYNDLITAAASGAALPLFQKYFNGQWNQPGLGGLSSSVLPNGPYWGDMNVTWDNATNQFIALAANAGISITESADGFNWVPSILLESSPNGHNYEYMAPTGTGADPSVLGNSFYVFFTDYQGWPSTVDRMTVSCSSR